MYILWHLDILWHLVMLCVPLSQASIHPATTKPLKALHLEIGVSEVPNAFLATLRQSEVAFFPQRRFSWVRSRKGQQPRLSFRALWKTCIKTVKSARHAGTWSPSSRMALVQRYVSWERQEMHTDDRTQTRKTEHIGAHRCKHRHAVRTGTLHARRATKNNTWVAPIVSWLSCVKSNNRMVYHNLTAAGSFCFAWFFTMSGELSPAVWAWKLVGNSYSHLWLPGAKTCFQHGL